VNASPENVTVGATLLGVLGALLYLVRGHFDRMERHAAEMSHRIGDLTVAITKLVEQVNVIRTTPPIGVPWRTEKPP
jgi:hypothetical protein